MARYGHYLNNPDRDITQLTIYNRQKSDNTNKRQFKTDERSEQPYGLCTYYRFETLLSYFNHIF